MNDSTPKTPRSTDDDFVDPRPVHLPFERWTVVDQALTEFITRTAPADEGAAQRQRQLFALFSLHALEDSSPIGPDLNASRAAFGSAMRKNTEGLSESDLEFVQALDALDPKDPDFVPTMEALVLATR